MVRRVFFSFHFERDIWRANVVRNSWVTQDREAAGFWDASLWEKTKTKGEEALKKLIDEGLKGTSVTVVLIGKETSNRKWVKYEITESIKKGNGILGIYINKIKDKDGKTDDKGDNPLDKLKLSKVYPTFDWLSDDGYKNIGKWVEEAATKARR